MNVFLSLSFAACPLRHGLEIFNCLAELWSKQLALTMATLLLELQFYFIEQYAVLLWCPESSLSELLLILILLVKARVRVKELGIPLTHLGIPIVDYGAG